MCNVLHGTRKENDQYSLYDRLLGSDAEVGAWAVDPIYT